MDLRAISLLIEQKEINLDNKLTKTELSFCLLSVVVFKLNKSFVCDLN
jgi:hypothetical protein